MIFSCFFTNSSRFYRKNRRRKKTRTIKLVIVKIIKIQVNVTKYEIVNITLNSEIECNLINKVFARKLALLSFDDAHINVVSINKLLIKIQSVYFLYFNITNRKNYNRFFEKFFLKIDIDNHIILSMS